MNRNYPFVLANVFAETHFGGNPLAVFPEAEGLGDTEMQAIAKQFNLSETVFAFGDKLRIFTPDYELPLAGHPVIGASVVLQKLRGLPDRFTLHTRAKPVDIRCADGRAVMRIAGYTCEAAAATAGEFAQILGLHTTDLAEHAYRVNSGSEQLLMQVMSLHALQGAAVDAEGLRMLCRDCPRDVLYLWYEEGDTVHSRLFFTSGQTVLEDSGTGSACANLGAYYAHCGRAPLTRTIFQGDGMGRPNRLSLAVDNDYIEVGGQVIEVGSGMFYLPE
ncbi:PhzF family phenazine biosynthesis protein [Neisseria sp.]|uniref:PhzF family phenazine biosynthesis protein n=1 Tax=Neisseria sp. TaxID=192066 RepID=UPI0026DD39CE|nr:PhzF family phenazine biosynthesis protein [Neisseria sp.]MDO4227322.1 PhzF family phenazine biosynthesis protein [Neisseria sp.]